MKTSASLTTLLLSAGLFLASPMPGQDVELLLHYNFDEASSGTDPAIDLSGAEPRVDGRFFDGATRTGNTPGGTSIGALDLTAENANVLLNHSNPNVQSLDGKLDHLDQVTITFWLNLQGIPEDRARVFAADDTGGGFGFRITEPQVGELSASNFSFGLDTVDGYVASFTDVDADNRWVFFAVTFDGSVWEDMIRYYIGDEEAEAALVNSQSVNVWDVTTEIQSPMRIGRRHGEPYRQMNGLLDDFRVYRGVMTAEQIERVRLENLQPQEPEPGTRLVIHYNFDEASSGTEPTLDRGEVEPLIDGRFFGTATRTTNTPGNASLAALDVSDGDASVLANPLDGKLDNLTAFTATLWVNLQEDPANFERIFRAGGNTGGGTATGFGFRIATPPAGTISASNFGLVLDLGSGGVNSNVAFDADDKWLFLAVTFDASVDAAERVKFFSGDALTATVSRAVGASTLGNTGILQSPLRLGRHPDQSDRRINGFIDDFRVYDGALTIEEIEEIRLAGLEGDGAPATGFAAWQNEFFTAEELQDPSISGPAADSDGDGLSNLFEYALGGSPWESSRHLLPVGSVEQVVVNGTEANYLTLSFIRPDNVTNIEYIVESSAGLQEWNADAVLVDVSPVDGGVLETYRSPAPVSSEPRAFLRLRVEQN